MEKTLMIVDDSRVVHREMKKILAGTEFKIVAECHTGEDALALYEECKPDIVTMDIVMPGIDGLQAARTLLERHPDAKVVMLSSLAYDDTIDEAVKIGAKTFVFKPVKAEQLLSTLRSVVK